MGSESRASSQNVPALEGSPSPGNLVSSVPLSSQPPRVSPSSADLPSTTNTIHDLSTPPIADCPQTIPLSHFLPSGQITYGLGIESAEEFFTAALGKSEKRQLKGPVSTAAPESSKKRQVKRLVRTAAPKSSENKQVKRLVHIARSFSKARELSDGSYAEFWSKFPPIFSVPEVGSDNGDFPAESFEAGVGYRLRRLKKAREHIQKTDWQADRLWLLCLTHEVEHISMWNGIRRYTRLSVTKMSAALDMAELFMGGTVRDFYKRGRYIFQVMKEGGPAAMLLEDGDTPRST